MNDQDTPAPPGSDTASWYEALQTPEGARYWLSAVVESADDAIISKSLDGVIASWNHGAERIFGYTADEVIGKPVTILIPPDHLDEEPAILANIRSGHRVEHYETVRVRKDGSRVDISLTVSPIRDANDKIIGASKIARDISGRKLAEAAVREQADIIKTVNRLGQTLASELDLPKLAQAVVDAATEVSGARFALFYYIADSADQSSLARAEAGAVPESLSSFPPPSAADLFSSSFKTAGTLVIDDTTEDRPPVCSFAAHVPPDQINLKSCLAVPVLSRSGEVYGGLYCGHPKAGAFSGRAARIVEGVAAQASIAMENARLYEAAKIARAAAERAAEQAEESSRLKDEFLATISHELRTPLNAILGWTRILNSGKLPPDDALKALQTVERNARAQAQLIDDLLDVSRIITGKLRMDVRPTNPAAFAEAAIEAIKPAAVAKDIRIRKVFDTDALAVAGDAVRLQQVVWNLLSNAVKFTPAGGQIEVTLRRIDSQVQLAVSDTGQGIAPEFLPHVFDRFRQADQASTRQHGGMGLGLAIVRHLVELHGGSVAAESAGPGRGATFIVRLPVSGVYYVDKVEGRIHSGAPEFEVQPASNDRLDGVRVLIVDDDTDTREFLKAGLEHCGADILLSGSAAEALASLKANSPDIIISDIGMPAVDGYQLINSVRALPPEEGGKIPAVALTAYARFEDRLKALKAGYQMHVPKPVELTELVTVINSLMGRVQ
jgi:PAS domain S-box-containing protein